MQARYYDPVIGRFLSNDPAGFAEMGPGYFNRYSYTFNDPVNKTDPTGMWVEDLVIGVPSLIIGGASAASNISQGNWGAAALDVGGMLVDAGANALPGVPGGAGLAIQGGRQAIKHADTIADVASGARRTCCFVAGTLVETESGLEAIETIELGDYVWARDTETGETALKEVTRLFEHQRIIWVLTLSGENGASEVFETTDDHPWWIIDAEGSGEWLNTEQLAVGMTVVSRTDAAPDRFMTVTSVEATARLDTTYNITVADFHTYFVGENRVLVHNCGGRRTPSPALQDDPFSPQSVSHRQSETRGDLGLNRDPDSEIGEVSRSPGEAIQGRAVRGDTSRGGDSRPAHGTGERNVGTREEHSRNAKGSDPGPRRRDRH